MYNTVKNESQSHCTTLDIGAGSKLEYSTRSAIPYTSVSLTFFKINNSKLSLEKFQSFSKNVHASMDHSFGVIYDFLNAGPCCVGRDNLLY